MFRIINTTEPHVGPRGVRYVHDAARPFAVLFASNRGEICSARCATMERAEAVMAGFVAARLRWAARHTLGAAQI